MEKMEIRAFNFENIGPDEPVNGRRRLEGRAIVYGSMTNIGPFDEIIERGALDETDLKDVRLLLNHNTNGIPLARSRNNNENSTMQLMPDDDGLAFRADIDIKNNMEAKALSSAVDRGDLSGMSFMMVGVRDRWENPRSEHPTRHIVGIRKVLEISAVTFPAYTDTSIENRGNFNALESAMESLESAKAAEEEEERDALAAEAAAAEQERRTAVLEWLENYKKGEK